MYTSDIENRQHWSLLEHRRIGVGKLPMSMLSKIVVLLRSTNFHRHHGGWLPRNLTVFLAVFLGAVSWKLSLTIPLSCESSKCRVIWSRVNARRHRPPPPARPLPHSHDSVSTTVQLCGADFARRACFWADVADHVRPSTRTSRASRGDDLNRPVLRPTICRLLPMWWLTSRKWSFCRFAKNFSLNMLNSSWISFAFSCQGC